MISFLSGFQVIFPHPLLACGPRWILHVLSCLSAGLSNCPSGLPRWYRDEEFVYQGRRRRSCGFDPCQEEPLEEEMAAPSGTVAWTEEPDGLQSTASRRESSTGRAFEDSTRPSAGWNRPLTVSGDSCSEPRRWCGAAAAWGGRGPSAGAERREAPRALRPAERRSEGGRLRHK